MCHCDNVTHVMLCYVAGVYVSYFATRDVLLCLLLSDIRLPTVDVNCQPLCHLTAYGDDANGHCGDGGNGEGDGGIVFFYIVVVSAASHHCVTSGGGVVLLCGVVTVNV